VSLRICSRDMRSPPFPDVSGLKFDVGWEAAVGATSNLVHRTSNLLGGEDRNRTYLGPACAGSTTVLKTARATRHPSLSPEKKTCWSIGVTEYWRAELPRSLAKARRESGRCLLRQGLRRAREGPSHIHLAFLIALTTASKSGQSPDSSLE
jgi:hypothetical protein